MATEVTACRFTPAVLDGRGLVGRDMGRSFVSMANGAIVSTLC